MTKKYANNLHNTYTQTRNTNRENLALKNSNEYLADRIAALEAENAELQEAAGQVYDRYCRGTSYTNEDEKWKRTLRALLNKSTKGESE